MKNKYLNYILLFALVAISGWPFIAQYEDTIIIVLLIVSIPMMIIRRINLNRSFFVFLGVFVVLTYIQLTTFNVFPQRTLFGFFSKIIIAYVIIKLVNRSFIGNYVNLMFIITLISFLFWIPSFLSNQLRNFVTAAAPFNVVGFDYPSYIIYQTNMGDVGELARNCGPYWEPGAFAGFLIIALIFNHIKSQNLNNRKSLVLIAGVLSTFSTTAYIALFLFIVLMIVKYRSPVRTALFLIIIIPISIYAFQELPFLKDKISDQIEVSESDVSISRHRNRFTSAIIDLEDFKEYPLSGRGKYDETRFDIGVKATNRNNGTTDLLVMYGLVGFIIYFTYYFISFRSIVKFYNRKNKLLPVIFVVLILVIGFSENYFLLPFFWGLCFLGNSFAGQVMSESPVLHNHRSSE